MSTETEQTPDAFSLPTTTMNNVVVVGPEGPGAAYHTYIIEAAGKQTLIQYQCGPRLDPSSTTGVLDDDLLAIVEHRLASFQAGPFATDHNEDALFAVRAARRAMGARVADRVKRAVLGTYER